MKIWSVYDGDDDKYFSSYERAIAYLEEAEDGEMAEYVVAMPKTIDAVVCLMNRMKFAQSRQVIKTAQFGKIFDANKPKTAP